MDKLIKEVSMLRAKGLSLSEAINKVAKTDAEKLMLAKEFVTEFDGNHWD